MVNFRLAILSLAALQFCLLPSALAEKATVDPAKGGAALLGSFVDLVDAIAGTDGESAPRVQFSLKLVEGKNVPDDLIGRKLQIQFAAPDRLRVSAEIGGKSYLLGRQGNSLWFHQPEGNFGLLAKPGIPVFPSEPELLDNSELPPFTLDSDLLKMIPVMAAAREEKAVVINRKKCRVLTIAPSEAAKAIGLKLGTISIFLEQDSLHPARLSYDDGKESKLVFDIGGFALEAEDEPGGWSEPPADDFEVVPLAHMKRFFPAAISSFDNEIPSLGPVTGERKLLAKSGKGWLEEIDGTKVVFLSGSPQEIGRQHGELLGDQVRFLVDRVLYGFGIGSSFGKGRWFFGEIQEAQRRLEPHMDKRYLEEADALAKAVGLHPQEMRLVNIFPELFHCSGFAVFGEATADGSLYHGRVLDYLRGLGLEQNAVVMVMRPDDRHAWVNVGYAGFIGTVTAMNEKGIAIGEMGGRGEGQWDGKPMAHLMREVMEQAESLDEAVEIMRRGPRTCEYYYVISDAETGDAVGIAATPDTFEVIKAGQYHPRLPNPVKDTVLMSAGDRYEELSKRVKTQAGKLDAESSLALMSRPVCMESNIQSVLFAPDTLDFWVANADSEQVASHTRYTKYNLKELLESKPPEE